MRVVRKATLKMESLGSREQTRVISTQLGRPEVKLPLSGVEGKQNSFRLSAVYVFKSSVKSMLTQNCKSSTFKVLNNIYVYSTFTYMYM